MAVHVFIIILFFGSATNGYGNEYSTCSCPWSCGNLSHIGYPFWGPGRPKYCGHPELQLLSCNSSDGFPVLQIGDLGEDSSVSFLVLGISNYSKNSSTIKLIEKHPKLNACPTDFIENHVFKDVFNFSTNVSITHLFHDCRHSALTKSPANESTVTCSDNDGRSKSAYYLKNFSDSQTVTGSLYEGCEIYEVPVFRKELNKLQQGHETLRGVLKQGFEVEFDSTECIDCQSSGGVCGSSSSPPYLFACYGKNGSHSHDFRKSEKPKVRFMLELGSLGVVIVFLVLVVYYIRIRHMRHLAIFANRRGTQNQNIESFLQIYGSLAPKRYTYTNIRKMTNHFKDKLGEGGYGTVYRGKLPDGRLVAVKLLKQVKGNSDNFINEVVSISRTNHVNIVALLGFCFEGNKRSLIYEFMSNGSLERFTYRGANYMSLSWETMFNIALGIARGLHYLHRGCTARILHFDIKPHNILLDDEFHPKISDFGLARLCPQQESTISMLEARGTIGYIAPEVFCRNFGGASHKSDVYSYGMMILDLVCGRENTSTQVRHSSEMYFPEWIYNRLEHGEEDAVFGILNDQELELQKKMILVSLWCIQTYPSNRPSMDAVTEMLNGSLESIQMPPKPYTSSPPSQVVHTSETSITI